MRQPPNAEKTWLLSAAGACWKETRMPYGENVKAVASAITAPRLTCLAPPLNAIVPVVNFPCKHAIGLLLIFISRSEAFAIKESGPEWVEEWLATRRSKTSTSVDPALVAQRQEKNAVQRLKTRSKRLEQMTQGVKDLETWLLDLVRQGLASTEQYDYNYWQEIAARMVDNKLGGVGLKIRSMPLLQGGNTEWPEQMLSELAELYLLARGLQNLEKLPEPLQDQLLAVAGLNTKKDDLLAQVGLEDIWMVLGQFTGVNIDNGTYRRTWLRGTKTDKKALLLEYDYRDAGFVQNWPLGQLFKAKLVYYPGSYPLRAAVGNPEFIDGGHASFSGHSTLDSFFAEYAGAVQANPWIMDFPACLESVRPVYADGELHLIDAQKKAIPLVSRDNLQWKLLAISGSHPVKVFWGMDG